MRLYHFCCFHSAVGIRSSGELRPNLHPLLDRKVIWLTDLEMPQREDVGLTSTIIKCDRMEFRAVVEADAQRWTDYLRELPRGVRLKARALTAGAGLPMHWYVSEAPLPIVEIGAAA